MAPPSQNDDFPPKREELLALLGEEELRAASLDKERAQVDARIATLRARIQAPPLPPPDPVGPANPPARSMSSADKLRLFRTLFRGRVDVYPKLWVNLQKNKKGYAPACRNEWVKGICEKPKVKCGECPHQAFLPVTDDVLLGHIQGRHVVGVYPMLADETCWLLAVDFDDDGWQADVSAFVASSRAAGLSPAIERSRSGNGAHAWFFFSAPVAASVARAMGCHLITGAMARRPELTLKSYDRLFPSQDTMPRGGFGNLIALPFQDGPRESANTVFLDDDFAPFPDQWAYLASLIRIAPAVAERIVREAATRDEILAVRRADVLDEDGDGEPWARAPSGHPRPTRIAGPLPAMLRATLAQRLFVDKTGAPPALLNAIRRLAAFQNPEFYKRQRMRLSTALTPRVISCGDVLPLHISLPRGCGAGLQALLDEHGMALTVDDQREAGAPVDVRFHGALVDVQQEAAKALLNHDIGVLVAPPGAGKTVIGAYLVSARARSTLVLVHRQPLLEQWRAQLALFLGVAAAEIGQLGGGKRTLTGRIDVAMIQSLVRKGSVDDVVASYGHVVVDECHHVPAASFERVLSEVKARFVVGLTATPHRRDGLHPISEMQLGPIRFTVRAKGSAEHAAFEHRLVVRETAFADPGSPVPGEGPAGPASSIQTIYAALAGDHDRNRLVVDDIIAALEERRSPIVLTERKDHLDYLADRLRGFARHMVILKGGRGVKERRAVAAQLAAIPANEERLVLAIGRYIGEGFDDARLDTLFLARPIAWKGTLVQYAGRLHRQNPGKRVVRIYDYADCGVPMLARMFAKRLKGYREMGYAREEVPRAVGQALEETHVEYDDD